MSFKIGDVVQLMCGGPLMTIVSVPDSTWPDYGCVWFIDGKPLEHRFPGPALKRRDDVSSR